MSEKKYNAWVHYSRTDQVLVPAINAEQVERMTRAMGEKKYWPFEAGEGISAVINMASVKWIAFEEVDDEETE